jgi:hypothetical protein
MNTTFYNIPRSVSICGLIKPEAYINSLYSSYYYWMEGKKEEE